MSLTGRLRRLVADRPVAIPPAEAARLVEQDLAVLLDVREPGEWKAGHAPRARHVPLGQLADRLDTLANDERLIIGVCRSGGRSARATAQLARKGHRAANLAGGMTAWAASGLPVVSGDGGPGRVI